MKILLVGNPNVGKTTLFNMLTGAHARTGNYHGVTVSAVERKCRFGEETVCDLAGIYSLGGWSMEEKSASEYILSQSKENTAIVFVTSAEGFSSCLPLLRSVKNFGYPMTVAVTMTERFIRRGGKIDFEKAEKVLGVKCIPVNGYSKKSVKNLYFSLKLPMSLHISELNGKYETFITPIKHKKLSPLLNPIVAFPVFFLFVSIVFLIAFAKGGVGDVAKSWIGNTLLGIGEKVKCKLKYPLAQKLVCDGLIGGVGSVLSFLPQIAIVYLFLDILEESGYLSALAYATDGLFSLVGLSGRSIFSVLLGFGCTAVAVSSTRSLEEKNIQRRAVFCLQFIPCSAKLPVYLALLSAFLPNPILGVVLLYILNVGFAFAFSAITKDTEEDFIMEIADICIPNPFFLLKKLLFQLKQFIIKVSTVVLIFTLAVEFLSCVDFGFSVCPIENSILASVCSVLRFVFAPIGLNDWRAAFSAIGGIVAKENVIGLLQTLYFGNITFSVPSAIAYLIFIAFMPPCISTFATNKTELGGKTARGLFLLQLLFALIASYLVYALILRPIISLVVVCFGILIYYIFFQRRKHREKLYRNGS